MKSDCVKLCRDISALLIEKGHTVGTAESCTGGRISSAITALSGASTYFKGGIVSYTNEIKEKLLSVSHSLLEEKGAVCEEVAVEMVKGACRVLGTDYAISATGFAGPTGGDENTPVGTIWVACGKENNVRTLRICEDNGREQNIASATEKVLRLFLEYLNEEAAI